MLSSLLRVGLKLTPTSASTTTSSSSSPSALSVSRLGGAGPGGGPGGGGSATVPDRITAAVAAPVSIKQEPLQQQQQQAATAAATHPGGSMETAAYVDSTTFPPLEPQEAEYSLEEIGNGKKTKKFTNTVHSVQCPIERDLELPLPRYCTLYSVQCTF